MTTITAKTVDQPLTADGAMIFATLPAGRYEFRPGAEGGVLVVATMDTAARPIRAQIEDDNAICLQRHAAAAGGSR